MIPAPLVKLPVADESFSSWLARQSFFYGHSVDSQWRFLSGRGYVLPAHAPASGDLFVPREVGENLEAACRLPTGTIRGLTLEPAGERLGLDRLLQFRNPAHGRQWNQAWVWSEPASPYCPECLRAEPLFRLSWRFAWSGVCREHLLLLRQDCPGCGRVPVRRAGLGSVREPTQCRVCGCDFRSAASAGAVAPHDVFGDAIKGRSSNLLGTDCDSTLLSRGLLSLGRLVLAGRRGSTYDLVPRDVSEAVSVMNEITEAFLPDGGEDENGAGREAFVERFEVLQSALNVAARSLRTALKMPSGLVDLLPSERQVTARGPSRYSAEQVQETAAAFAAAAARGGLATHPRIV